MTEAKKRGLKIITELVINHTSDQHPWFQRAHEPPGTDARNWYVWSDTTIAIGDPHHLHGYRKIKLVLGSGRRCLLLASLLLTST